MNADFSGSNSTGGSVNPGFKLNNSGSNPASTSFPVNSTTSNTPTPTPTGVFDPTSTSGRTVNSDLPIPPGRNNVPRPSGTPGGLVVINWAGFTGGAASFTFDDGCQSQIDHYSELNALGVRMTFYLISSWVESSNGIWAQALKDGHELGNHSDTHPLTAIASDIDNCTIFFQQRFGVTPLTMAAPYGGMSYPPLAQSRFLLNRGVWGGAIAPNDNTDPYNLLCNGPAAGASAADMTSPFSAARSLGKWQIYLVHGFIGGTDGAFQPVDINQFIRCVNTVKEWGDMWIDTVLNIGAYWRAQKLFASLTPTASGRDLIYTWTLPAHFPTNRYLRVKVTGGTLKQNGRVLNWDSHGYYEISLDGGSLTLSP